MSQTKTLLSAIAGTTNATVGTLSDQWNGATLSIATTAGTAIATVTIYAQSNILKKVFEDTVTLNGSTVTAPLGNVAGILYVSATYKNGSSGTLTATVTYNGTPDNIISADLA